MTVKQMKTRNTLKASDTNIHASQWREMCLTWPTKWVNDNEISEEKKPTA